MRTLHRLAFRMRREVQDSTVEGEGKGKGKGKGNEKREEKGSIKPRYAEAKQYRTQVKSVKPVKPQLFKLNIMEQNK